MRRNIYILTIENGKGISHNHVQEFRGRKDFLSYAENELCRSDTRLRADATVAEICDALVDQGPGFGSRWSSRCTREEACRRIRAGANNLTASL